MELYGRVRLACHVQGMSKSEAARHFGIDRRTVSKILVHSVPPGYRRIDPPVRPKLDPFVTIIDQILEEDKSLLKKRRHTAKRMTERLDAIEATLGRRPGTVTADRGYGIGRIYEALTDRDICAVIPPRPSTRQAKAKGFPIERFSYDAACDIARCPRKKRMTPCSATKTGRWFRAEADACRTCLLQARCIPDGGVSRRVHITRTHVATLRARRKRRAWGAHETNLYSRHHWLAKTLHGMARAARRGLENMKIQALLTPTAINLKRRAKAILFDTVKASLSAKNDQPITARSLSRADLFNSSPRIVL